MFIKYCILFYFFFGLSSRANDLFLECISASNDWYVHLEVKNNELHLYSTSIWGNGQDYYKGSYSLVKSDYTIKDLDYQKNCHEINDNDGEHYFSLKYCLVVDSTFYKVDAIENEKIQEMFLKNYQFGMGEIEFFNKIQPISSGTLFYCFQQLP